MDHLISLGLLILLPAWLVYRRIHRTIGFQKLLRRRLVVRIWIMAIIGALVVGAGVVHPLAYLGDAAGLVAGGLLAYAAVRYLTFEQRDGDWYYRTHVWVESVVLVLFLGRLVYRIVQSIQEGRHQQGAAQMADPLTSGALVMFVCYYIVFAVVLLRREWKLVHGAGDTSTTG